MMMMIDLYRVFILLLCCCSYVTYGKLKRSVYDKNVNLFSEEGELLQVKYAKNAGLQGGSVVCATRENSDLFICVPNTTELPILLDRRSVDKVSKIDDDIWFAFAGLAGDGRALIGQARKYCIDYRSQFGCSPTGRLVASTMGQLQHEASLSGNKRPYGVQLLVFAYNSDSKQFDIFQCEPSGEVTKWFASAIGMNSATMLKDLERDYDSAQSNSDLVNMLAKITDKGLSSSENEEGITESESKTKQVNRLFYRLYRQNDKVKLSSFFNKDDLLNSLTQ